MTEIFETLEQQSNAWFEARQGKMTASAASKVGSNGKGLETYCRKIVAELLSIAEPVRFSNIHTERGNELEPVAKAAYEKIKGVKVREIGFAKYSDYVGCSPDGLVGEDGLVEIKCPADSGYVDYLLEGKIKSEYVWQMEMQMLILDKQWCDFVVFNPNFSTAIKIVRVYPDKVKKDKLLAGFETGEGLIKEYIERMTNV